MHPDSGSYHFVLLSAISLNFAKCVIILIFSEEINMPSENKQAFLKQTANSKTMLASRVESIANHYRDKKIIIYKNGSTPFGKQIIAKKIAKYEEIHEKRTRNYCQNNELKYANYALRGFDDEIFTLHPESIGQENYLLIKKLLKNYLLPAEEDAAERFKCLTKEECIQLNTLLANNPTIKELFDKQISEFLNEEFEELQAKVKEYCLKNSKAWQEINAIRAQLKDNEAVGYVYTNGSNLGSNHFEVLIITKQAVIKPLSWFTVENTFKQSGKNQFAFLPLNNPAILKTKGPIPSPQADMFACGTLGFLYLKQLLKEDNAQLKQYSLVFPYYNEKDAIQSFFYPSPQVLKYSQSSKYCEVVKAMLVDSEEAQNLTFRGEVYAVTTLKGLLKQTLNKAQELKHEPMQKYAIYILNKLPEFRKKWLEAYAKAMEERASMDEKLPEKDVNHYLSYCTRRMQKYVETPVSVTQEPRLFQLVQIQAPSAESNNGPMAQNESRIP